MSKYCEKCTNCSTIINYSYWRTWNRALKKLSATKQLLCQSCSTKQRWANKNDKFNSIETKNLQSCKIKNAWKHGNYDHIGPIIAEKLKSQVTPEFREKQRKITLDAWKDEKYRTIQAIKRHSQRSCSSIQETLYSILDGLGIKYYREYKDKVADKETIIDYYGFDCVIPRENNKTLLIECQGDYWHSLPKQMIRDKQKASYIKNNFHDKYELKYIWEYEFEDKNKVIETIKSWITCSQI